MLGGFSPIVLHPSEACTDKWIAIFELKVILAMLVRSLGFRDAAAVVDGKGGCHCCMLSLRESTARKFFGKRISRRPSRIARTRNSYCGIVLYPRLERKQRRRKEVGMVGVMELVRDFAEESA